MGYEIDFIGVDEDKKDADAISIRWSLGNGVNVNGVYDGGFQVHGEGMTNHINKYYFNDKSGGVLDFVICSHSDQDHASGLGEILKNFSVKALYMNRPWLYIDELFDKVNDGRITKNSLERQLKEKYQYIAELEAIAIDKGIKIYEIFQGHTVCNKLRVLSPTKDFYMSLLVESSKTPLSENASILEKFTGAVKEMFRAITESWSEEKLREDVVTTAENEMSAIVLGEMDSENFLLTGDAGIRGIREAIDYATCIGMPLKTHVKLYQMPHHGSRHNVSTSILNELLGETIAEGTAASKSAIVCVGKNSDNPKQMVANAFIRRGVSVVKADGKTIHHNRGMGQREGWTTAPKVDFNTTVEDWD